MARKSKKKTKMLSFNETRYNVMSALMRDALMGKREKHKIHNLDVINYLNKFMFNNLLWLSEE